MNKAFRSFIVIMLAASSIVLMSSSSSFARSDETSPAALGCDTPRGNEYDLKNSRGKKRPGIGALKVYERHNTGYNRWCIIVKSGRRTLGVTKPMGVAMAWYRPGERIVFTYSSSLFDSGPYRNYAGSVYSTGRAGHCLAIKGYLNWKGKAHVRTVRKVYCYD